MGRTHVPGLVRETLLDNHIYIYRFFNSYLVFIFNKIIMSY
jgi:hypothetical protein